MTRRGLAIAAVVSLVLCLISILWIDAPLARTLNGVSESASAVVSPGVRLLEIVFAFDISKFALGLLALVVGMVLLGFRTRRPAGWALVFVSASHLTSRLLAGVLKNVFARLRPFELLESGAWDHQFFQEGGSSFPSGHAVHFWGLFFALAYLFPRYRWPFLILPVFVSIARVVVNDHFAGDVLASVAIAAAVTLGFAYLPVRSRRGALRSLTRTQPNPTPPKLS
jgi:membrane-associated phospholipid phosphatase